MKKTEYIEIKRQYLPPEVQLIELEAEGLLDNYVSGQITEGGFEDGDEEGGGNSKAKRFYFIENDEVLE